MLRDTPHIGFARQVFRAANLRFPESYGLTTDAIQDHAVVLTDNVGNIIDETTLVILKTDEKNCRAFLEQSETVASVNLAKDHGALGQCLVYVVGDLVNCLARQGVLDEERIEITR